MLVRPMLGGWEVPRIEGIRSWETRRLATLPVPGLSGDLHQDLGRGAIVIELSGSLSGDEARDVMLQEVRTKFLAGDPVDFVADIIGESELEQVLIERLHFAEHAAEPGGFRYSLRLREYTEPPEPPGFGEDFGLDVDLDLGLDIDLGLDLLDLAGLLGDVPEIGDMLTPVKVAAEGLKSALAEAGSLFEPLDELLG
jgi:hypothetical protein